MLYLSLTVSALTCALHHGLTAACPHHGAAAATQHVGAAHGGHEAPAPEGAHFSLCHCLDNLAADTPSPLLAAAPVMAPALLAHAPAAPARVAPVGPAAPRGPPAVRPA